MLVSPVQTDGAPDDPYGAFALPPQEFSKTLISSAHVTGHEIQDLEDPWPPGRIDYLSKD